jgi:hypothetical protein
MVISKKEVERIAVLLEETARHDDDLAAAKTLRELLNAYEVAKEIVLAKTYEHSRDAYAELVTMVKGKKPGR